MKRSFYNRRQGALPYSRRFCWVKDRIRASNMIKNVLRAVRAGNCRRAERILDSREYDSSLACVSLATVKRVRQRVRKCKEK